MTLDLGLQGYAILAGCALIFGVIAQLIFWRSATHWLWLIAAIGYAVGGFIASEVVWGTMTEGEIQPIIDGLAFDESLLGGLIVGVPTALATWLLTRHSAMETPAV